MLTKNEKKILDLLKDARSYIVAKDRHASILLRLDEQIEQLSPPPETYRWDFVYGSDTDEYIILHKLMGQVSPSKVLPKAYDWTVMLPNGKQHIMSTGMAHSLSDARSSAVDEILRLTNQVA